MTDVMLAEAQQDVESRAGARPAQSGTSRRSLVLGVAAAGAALALCLSLASPLEVLASLAAFLLFAAPGIGFGIALFGHDFRRHPESLILGTAAGMALSGYVTLSIGYLQAWSPGWSSLAILALTLVSALVARRYWDQPLVPAGEPWDARDYSILSVSCLVLIAFVTIPYLAIGKPTSEGHGYAWLFGFDFLLRAAFATSITQGLPPDYMHLAGNPLRYYLVAYTLPAFAYSLTRKMAELHSILLTVQVCVNLLFLACLQVFLRRFVRSRSAMLWTMLTALVSYSYYGWYVIAKLLVRLAPTLVPARISSGLMQFGDMSHLYQRLFLVEPQALTGLCIFVLVFYVCEKTGYSLKNYAVNLLLAVLIGIEFGIEGWQGLALAFWFGGVHVIRLLRDRRLLGSELLPFIITMGTCAIVYLSYFAMGMYQFASAQALAIKPYWWVMALSPIYFPLEYGPMFILGVWAVVRLRKSNSPGHSVPVFLLLALILLQIFFVTAEVLPEFGLLRGNRLLPLLLLLWTGLFYQEVREKGNRWMARAVPLLLLLAAVPTYFTDIYSASNVHDRNNTHYVKPADLKACAWVKRNVPDSAIVQSEPDYIGHSDPVPRGKAIETSLIANFGERRMAVGESWIASTVLVNSKPIQMARHRDVERMFNSGDAYEIYMIARRYNISYLYVGPYEQKRHPNLLATVRSGGANFQEVYAADSVFIFRLIPSRSNP